MLKTKLKKQYLLAMFAMLTMVSAYGQTPRTSTGSGAWNNPATWTPAGVPVGSDDVTIAAGHIVTVPANATCRRLYISGTLNMTGVGITMDITNNSVSSPTNGLQLNAGGSLTIGASNIIYFSSGQASGIVNNGGTIVSTGANGSDGGTVRTNACCGGEFRISGSATTTLYNLDFLNNANFNIQSALVVNGKLSLDDNNWNCSSSALSPIYGPASTLHINWNGQGISSSGSSPLNNNLAKLWNQSTGTIGVTAGYPNNVTLLNMGTSNGNVNVPPNVNVGWRPGAMAIGLNGALQIGDATAPGTNTGFASLDQVTSFNSGGIVVDNASVLIGPPSAATHINRGNFSLQGATTGIYYNYGATINFAGSGTVGSPQTISTTHASGVVTFANMTVSNGTYVRIDDDVNITSTLNLTSGYIGTSATNSLNITNTATTAIVGGSSTAYVDGPLTRSFPASVSGNYVFPIGDLSGGAYLPLTLAGANSSGGTNVTAEAFNANPGGTHDGTINSMSTTEYWSINTSSPFSGGAQVSVTRPTPVSPFNSLGSSSASNGMYTAIGGSPGGNTISGGGLGNGSPVFVRLVNAILNVVRVGGASASVDNNCNPTSTGSLIVGGVGGTPPYYFSLNGGPFVGPFASTHTFSPLAKGSYDVTVRDATMATRTSALKVLGPLQINGNDQDIDICAGQSVTLTATNLQNSSPTYTWSPGGQTTASINVSPLTATTYTVQSTIYANNLIANGSFESGMPTGFDDHYDPYVGGAYGTTPDDGGYYTVNDRGSDQCIFFTTLPAQDGNNYFIGDANSFASNIFSLNIPGLTAGVQYRFSYWYAKGSNDNNGSIQTSVNGTPIGTVTVDNYVSWTQASYTFTAIAGTNTITLRNTVAIGSTNGNDFYIDNIQLLAPCTVTTSIDVTVDCSLPVELLNFDAVRQDPGALLTWSTSSEENSSHFVVERSLDGINFYPIGNVSAAGYSSSILNYSFTDPGISSGVTYYRLAQYDYDGALHYSDVKAVTKENVIGVQISPNPTQGIFIVTLDNSSEDAVKVSLINSIGQVIFENVRVVGNSMDIDISLYASGVYYLQVLSGSEALVKKIVKE